MADDALRLYFEIQPEANEAALLLECYDVSENIDSVAYDALDIYYDNRSSAFKAAFPRISTEDDPFYSFLQLFTDPDNPSFGVDFHDNDDGFICVSGREADPDALAKLIQKCTPSLLPFGFEWSNTLDKHGSGSFGGGYFLITEDEIQGGGTNLLLSQAMERLRLKAA